MLVDRNGGKEPSPIYSACEVTTWDILRKHKNRNQQKNRTKKQTAPKRTIRLSKKSIKKPIKLIREVLMEISDDSGWAFLQENWASFIIKKNRILIPRNMVSRNCIRSFKALANFNRSWKKLVEKQHSIDLFEAISRWTIHEMIEL